MVDLDVSPDVAVERLAPGERQLVEIAKALSWTRASSSSTSPPRRSRPARRTASSSSSTACTRQGKTIIYISHILRDVMRLADCDRRPARRRPGGPWAQGASSPSTA